MKCVLCGQTEGFTKLGARGIEYRICRKCGSAASSAGLDYDAYYSDYFPSGLKDDSPVLESRYRTLIERLARRTEGRRLLEVGCGNGQLLAVAQALGWSVVGVELSESQSEHVRRRGVDVRSGDLTAEPLLGALRFDVAIMIEVFEHLPDPVAMLRAIRRHMEPGSVVHVTTPNFNSLSRRLLGGSWSVLNHEHVVVATPSGLKQALLRSGFVGVRIRSRTLNVHECRAVLGGRSEGSTGAISSSERNRSAEELRDRIDASRPLLLAKAMINLGLSATKLGDSLVAEARVPGPALR